jgi:hypothetical protein
MATDFLLDNTHDLFVGSNDFALIKGGSEVTQNAKIRLLFIQGEWIYKLYMGVDWWDTMFNTNISKDEKKQAIIDTLAGTFGINKILEVKFLVDSVNKGALVSYRANTIYSTEVIGSISVVQ